jgi:hypothetical protein
MLLTTNGNVIATSGDTEENVEITPVVTHFKPFPGRLFCGCGREIQLWDLQIRNSGDAVLICSKCPVMVAEIATDVEVHG